MNVQFAGSAPALAYEGAAPSLEHLVFGLHWSPSPYRALAPDLDSLCMLFDAQDRLLETVHGGHPRNANGSVVHTGDSREGASLWDDEQIHVFAAALPAVVRRLAFVVACASGRTFCEVPGAMCHVSDPASEHVWLRVDLTALRGCRSQTVATLRRAGAGRWLAPQREAGLTV